MSEQSTYDLLDNIAAGNEQSFEILFRQRRNNVYHYLLRITKFPEIAEELTMDIFLKLWLGRDLLKQINDLDAFLYKMAHNKALDFFRTASRHDRLHAAYTEHIQQLHTTGQLTPVDNESKELLTKIINGLPPRRKLIYRLSREENMTYEQIANHLNLSPKTVKNTMLNALKEIREHLTKQNHDPKMVLWLFFIC